MQEQENMLNNKRSLLTSPQQHLDSSQKKLKTSTPQSSQQLSQLTQQSDEPKQLPESSVILFKNGKITFPTEKKLNLDRHPSTVKLLSDYFNSTEKDPSRFHTLLALLIEESEVSLSSLSKQILKRLVPEQFSGVACSSDFAVTEKSIQEEIQKLAQKITYGLQNVASKVKWECQDVELFPESVRSIILQRRQERQNYNYELAAYWQLLDIDQQAQLQQTAKNKRKDSELSVAAVPSSAVKPVKPNAAEQKRLKLQAEKQKFQRQQPSISGFFSVKKSLPGVEVSSCTVKQVTPKCVKSFDQYFPPFHVRPNVTVAQCIAQQRVIPPSSLHNSEHVVELSEWSKQKLMTSAKPLGIVDEELASRLASRNVKLLQFHENHRPAYYGTFNQLVQKNQGRKLFQKRQNIEYDFDSDDEWAEEAELGEELMSNDGDDEVTEMDDDEEEEDGWLVPAGYLSDDEGVEDGADERDRIPAPKAVTSKRQFQPQPPIVYGPILQEDVDIITFGAFLGFSVIRFIIPESGLSEAVPPSSTIKKTAVTMSDEAISMLVEHVNSAQESSVEKLCVSFQLAYQEAVANGSSNSLRPLTKKCIADKIKSVAKKQKVDGKNVWQMQL